MANYQAITFERHALKRWLRHDNHSATAGDTLCTLVLQELPKAAVVMPIGFVADGDKFVPVAIQGLKAGKNLLVNHEGRWVLPYVPAAYRGHPFRLAISSDGSQVLCVDEDSDYLSDIEGESFFDEEGLPTEALKNVFEFFSQIEVDRILTHAACAILHKHNLIQPWLINVQEEQGERQVEGIHRVDEVALNALSAEALAEVRDAGGLTIAYCQIISMQHIHLLGQLAHAHAEADKQRTVQSTMTQGDTFSFANL